MFDTVLVANRGEIALRVMRACRELGLRCVAVYSEADRAAPHVAYADAAYLIGPGPALESYLLAERILAAARESGAGAIHPGYGFLSENSAFARAVEAVGLIFVGPPAASMERMGGKTSARREAAAAGVPVVPGTLDPIESAAEVRRVADEFGYPVAIKAVGGGGGRGLRVVRAPSEVEEAFASARREAQAAFKLPDVYVEKYLDDPRHIEIQILADSHGNVIHLGERDCSVQRRHQKLIEESPSPALAPALRAEMGAAAVRLAQAVGYVGAGTLEFLYQDGRFYFLEMNTRIQVEHTVTEMVTGVDLVKAQLRVAQGATLPYTQQQIVARGHAIECRINAEDPAAGFQPGLGTISAYAEPAGFGVRVDSGVYAGWSIPQHYDSLLAKLVVWGESREEAVARMLRALHDFRLEGVPTTLGFHRLALAHPAFARGEATVNFIPRELQQQLASLPPFTSPGAGDAAGNGLAQPSRSFEVEVNNRRFHVRVAALDGVVPATAASAPQRASAPARPGGAVKRLGPGTAREASGANAVLSPIQGTVVAVRVQPGQAVVAGEVLFVVEAMKMENEVGAARAGTIKEILAAPGITVEAGATLATFEDA
jgi:acetyl-CoA/propionyl-CoA carboxylase, biotin carboxylase, biotin carboxyl carrier protein